MRWMRKAADERVAGALAAALGLPPIAARILASRGISTPEEAERFLSVRIQDLPDPFSMKGMLRAVERLSRAIAKHEKVMVYGDYDVDGVTSTSLLVSFLEATGADVGYYVPHRLVEGYGLNGSAVDKLAQAGTQLIVTVDCGVTAVEEVDRAAQAGVDVVVVDHHQAPAELPRAVAMLNPHQPGCPFPSKDLAAVGVTFHLLMALRKRLREEGLFRTRPEPNLRAYLDLVALGTIADVVPLLGANRILVAHGLQELEKSARPGVRALKEVAQIAQGPVTSGQVGFKLGPRINAAGRLDDAGTAVELLLATDTSRARSLAATLDRANQERREIEQEITEQALLQAKGHLDGKRGLVLYAEGWHPGVVGIVASRIVERYHRPTVVLGVDGASAKGSCRSIEAFDMYAGLGRCREHLVKFGGHHHAAGVHLEAKEIPAFARAFEDEALRQLSPEDLVPSMRIDADIHATDATLELAQALARLAPFGMGNPEPVLAAEVQGLEARVLPAKSGPADHLKFALGPADAIAFGMGEKLGVLRQRAQVAFQLTVDTWNGRTRASARVKAIEARA